jgi:hypothetical protein
LDLLEAPRDAADDTLPAWCDCGHRTLSRADILTWVADRERRVIVE